FFSSRSRHTSFSRDWSSDVCSSDLRCGGFLGGPVQRDRVKQIAVLVHWRSPSVVSPCCADVAVGVWRRRFLARRTPRGRASRRRSEERRVGKEGRSKWSQGVGTT